MSSTANDADRQWVARGDILFLNRRQAYHGRIGHQRLHPDYLLACRFFHCGIIDRTRTLETGFDYAVLDRIPELPRSVPRFNELCDAMGSELVSEAEQTRRPLRVFWSGGIDSTTAVVAIAKAAIQRGLSSLVHIMMSEQSVIENPAFYLHHINRKFPVHLVSQPVSDFLNPEYLNVTGEHGDQLFGSHLVHTYVINGVAHLDYMDVLPLVLEERLGDRRSAMRMIRYLEPQIAIAPVRILTLFDYMWWMNFSMKWQEVTLRLPVFCGDQSEAVFRSLRHFFRDARFQQWSIATTPIRTVLHWERYKDPAKQYILAYTGDLGYYLHKEKEDSLKNVMVRPEDKVSYRRRVVMRDDFKPVIEVVERRDQ